MDKILGYIDNQETAEKMGILMFEDNHSYEAHELTETYVQSIRGVSHSGTTVLWMGAIIASTSMLFMSLIDHRPPGMLAYTATATTLLTVIIVLALLYLYHKTQVSLVMNIMPIINMVARKATAAKYLIEVARDQGADMDDVEKLLARKMDDYQSMLTTMGKRQKGATTESIIEDLTRKHESFIDTVENISTLCFLRPASNEALQLLESLGIENAAQVVENPDNDDFIQETYRSNPSSEGYVLDLDVVRAVLLRRASFEDLLTL